MTITTGYIRSLLQPGLNSITQYANSYPAMYTQCGFETRKSEKAFEQIVEMKPLGLAGIRGEGNATRLDSYRESFKTTAVNREVALGFVITKQSMQDNLYMDQFLDGSKQLTSSLAITKDTLAASVLNNGTSTDFPIADGQPLFSTAHPLVAGGTQANRFASSTQFTQFSLQRALSSIAAFKDPAGLLRKFNYKKISCGLDSQWAVAKVLGSAQEPDSGNNAINPVNGIMPWCMNPYYTDTDAVYVHTDAPDGLIAFDRVGVTARDFEDPYTENLVYTASERYSFTCGNHRSVFAII